MQQKSMVKNAMYNFIYTGINLMFPLITIPYVSRVLGASNLGEVDFTKSIVTWFIIFASFGVTTYGVREIAKRRDNKEEMSKVFFELLFINSILSITMTIIFILTIMNVDSLSSNLPLLFIFSISIILNVFNIDWFYQGIEEYSYITIRNAIIKLLSVASIYLFVNSEEHYIVYGLIIVLGTSLTGIINIFHSRKYVKFKITNFAPLNHIKGLSVFFFLSFVMGIYINLDRTLLGFIIGPSAVAFMSMSKTIIDTATAISTTFSNVALPRASYYIKNDIQKFNDLVVLVPNFILWITIPISAGVFILSENILFIIGGEEFTEAAILLKVMSIVIILSPLAAYMNLQVLVPTGNEKYALMTATVASCLSLVINISLIPVIGFIGAGIALLSAECLIFILRYIIIRRKLGFTNLNFINKSTTSYLLVALCMAIIVLFTNNLINNLVISFIACAMIGASFYFIVLYLVKEDITLKVVKRLLKKLSA